MNAQEAAVALAEFQARLDAEYEADLARRQQITPHVRRAPKRKPGRMSGPRYFNLMRAIENNPDEYADYRPTTYCGAPLTTEDWDRRTALAKSHAAAVLERGVCSACLGAARSEAAP